MGAMARNKGARGERFVANFLREALGTYTRRGQQFKGTPDSPDVVGLPGIHIESKFVESLNLQKAFSQAESESGDNIPVVFHKKNHKPLMITLKAENMVEFCAIIRSIYLLKDI